MDGETNFYIFIDQETVDISVPKDTRGYQRTGNAI